MSTVTCPGCKADHSLEEFENKKPEFCQCRECHRGLKLQVTSARRKKKKLKHSPERTRAPTPAPETTLAIKCVNCGRVNNFKTTSQKPHCPHCQRRLGHKLQKARDKTIGDSFRPN